MIPIPYRLKRSTEPIRNALAQFGSNLRVAIPGIIQSFDADTQTVSVQPAISEIFRIDAVPTVVNLPLLEDVPIIIPRAGGFSVTLPIQPGDECLLIFADMCIDAWFQSGGVQGQPAKFRHAIGDGFAIVGPWNQTRVIENYSADSMQLRSDDGSVVVDVASDAVTVTAPQVNVVSPAITAAAQGGTPHPLMTDAFLTWFNAIYAPSVAYKVAEPPALAPAPLTTVLGAQ